MTSICENEQTKFGADDGQECVVNHAYKRVNVGDSKPSMVNFYSVKPTND